VASERRSPNSCRPRTPDPGLDFPAPSQCPRDSPASFIGGRVAEDEGIFLVGGGAPREVTPHPHHKQNVGNPCPSVS